MREYKVRRLGNGTAIVEETDTLLWLCSQVQPAVAEEYALLLTDWASKQPTLIEADLSCRAKMPPLVAADDPARLFAAIDWIVTPMPLEEGIKEDSLVAFGFAVTDG